MDPGRVAELYRLHDQGPSASKLVTALGGDLRTFGSADSCAFSRSHTFAGGLATGKALKDFPATGVDSLMFLKGDVVMLLENAPDGTWVSRPPG